MEYSPDHAYIRNSVAHEGVFRCNQKNYGKFLWTTLGLVALMSSDVSAANTGKRPFITLFVKLFHPVAGADRFARETNRLAFRFILLHRALDPFVVQIPAALCLVRRREAFITRWSFGFHQFLEARSLHSGQLGHFRCEDLGNSFGHLNSTKQKRKGSANLQQTTNKQHNRKSKRFVPRQTGQISAFMCRFTLRLPATQETYSFLFSNDERRWLASNGDGVGRKSLDPPALSPKTYTYCIARM